MLADKNRLYYLSILFGFLRLSIIIEKPISCNNDWVIFV